MDLKCCLHLHTNDDPIDKIPYSIIEAINCASLHFFDLLAITCHDKFVDVKPYLKYAQTKNIILIAGIEKTIENKHVLILNATKASQKINTFHQLKQYKKQNPYSLIIAPHPFFYLSNCLKNKLIEHIELFDAIEFNYFYTKFCNPNTKGLKIAKNYSKPVISTSDVHLLKYINNCFTTVHSKSKNINDIISAIKNNQLTNHNTPLKLWDSLQIIYHLLIKL